MFSRDAIAAALSRGVERLASDLWFTGHESVCRNPAA
jgi:hypothetical protein